MFEAFANIAISYTFNLQLIVAAFCLVGVLHDICRTRRQWGTAALHFAGVLAGMYGVSFAVFCLLYSTPVSSLWQPFAMLVVFAAYTVFFSAYDAKIRTVLASTLFSIFFISVETGGMLSYLLFDMFDSQAVRALCLPSALVYVVIAKCFDLNKYETVFPTIVVVDLFFNALVSSIVMMNSYICMSTAAPTWFNAAIMFAMLCVAFVIYLMTFAVAKTAHTNLMLFVENNLSKTNAYTLELLQKKSEDLRFIRHDIRNQFAYMELLLKGDRYDELKKYFDTLEHDFSASADSYIETGNLVLNSVLNMMAQKAAAKGVGFECSAAVPEKLPFSDVDLCSLITNLADNAIESCVRQRLEGGKVEVLAALRGENLYVCVRNPVADGTDVGRSLRLRTEKTEAGHGLGTKIVRRIAQKYGGGHNYTFSVIDGMFTAEVLLCCPTTKEDD